MHVKRKLKAPVVCVCVWGGAGWVPLDQPMYEYLGYVSYTSAVFFLNHAFTFYCISVKQLFIAEEVALAI